MLFFEGKFNLRLAIDFGVLRERRALPEGVEEHVTSKHQRIARERDLREFTLRFQGNASLEVLHDSTRDIYLVNI